MLKWALGEPEWVRSEESHCERGRDHHPVCDVVAGHALGVVLQPIAAPLAVHRFAPAELREKIDGTDDLVEARNM